MEDSQEPLVASEQHERAATVHTIEPTGLQQPKQDELVEVEMKTDAAAEVKLEGQDADAGAQEDTHGSNLDVGMTDPAVAKQGLDKQQDTHKPSQNTHISIQPEWQEMELPLAWHPVPIIRVRNLPQGVTKQDIQAAIQGAGIPVTSVLIDAQQSREFGSGTALVRLPALPLHDAAPTPSTTTAAAVRAQVEKQQVASVKTEQGAAEHTQPHSVIQSEPSSLQQGSGEPISVKQEVNQDAVEAKPADMEMKGEESADANQDRSIMEEAVQHLDIPASDVAPQETKQDVSGKAENTPDKAAGTGRTDTTSSPTTKSNVTHFKQNLPLDVYSHAVQVAAQLTQQRVTVQGCSVTWDAPTNMYTTLFLGNLAERVDDAMLATELAQYGQLERCYVVKGSSRRSKRYGFAEYSFPSSAQTAKMELEGKHRGSASAKLAAPEPPAPPVSEQAPAADTQQVAGVSTQATKVNAEEGSQDANITDSSASVPTNTVLPQQPAVDATVVPNVTENAETTTLEGKESQEDGQQPETQQNEQAQGSAPTEEGMSGPDASIKDDDQQHVNMQPAAQTVTTVKAAAGAGTVRIPPGGTRLLRVEFAIPGRVSSLFSRTVVLLGLSVCTEDDIRKVMSAYGPVVSAWFARGSHTKLTSRSAFVEFKYSQHAEQAVYGVDSKDVPTLGIVQASLANPARVLDSGGRHAAGLYGMAGRTPSGRGGWSGGYSGGYQGRGGPFTGRGLAAHPHARRGGMQGVPHPAAGRGRGGYTGHTQGYPNTFGRGGRQGNTQSGYPGGYQGGYGGYGGPGYTPGYNPQAWSAGPGASNGSGPGFGQGFGAQPPHQPQQPVSSTSGPQQPPSNTALRAPIMVGTTSHSAPQDVARQGAAPAVQSSSQHGTFSTATSTQATQLTGVKRKADDLSSGAAQQQYAPPSWQQGYNDPSAAAYAAASYGYAAGYQDPYQTAYQPPATYASTPPDYAAAAAAVAYTGYAPAAVPPGGSAYTAGQPVYGGYGQQAGYQDPYTAAYSQHYGQAPVYASQPASDALPYYQQPGAAGAVATPVYQSASQSMRAPHTISAPAQSNR